MSTQPEVIDCSEHIEPSDAVPLDALVAQSAQYGGVLPDDGYGWPAAPAGAADEADAAEEEEDGWDADEPAPEEVLVKPARAKRTEDANVQIGGQPRSVYEVLVEFGMLRKMTDIVMAKVSVPWYLRADAAQEIHTAWAGLTAKPTVYRDQLGHYAYLSGQHAALKLRRTIGAVVVIPGALFRTGRDTAFMESIGAAVNPKDVDDYKDSLELSTSMEDGYENAKVSEQLFKERLAGITLSAKQREVAERALLKRMCAESIAAELLVPVSAVERMLTQITQKIRNKDQKVAAGKPVKKPRGRRVTSNTLAA